MGVILFIGGFAWFAHHVQTPGKYDNQHTEALVVLTGGADRIEIGFGLLRAKYGEKLFISGVYQQLDVKRLLRSRAQNADIYTRVFVGLNAENTRQNAEETYVWLRQNNIRSLRLITAGYHMPRSLIEFQRVLPSAYRIIPHNVVPRAMHGKHVWSRGIFRLLMREYLKYLVVRFLPEKPSFAF
ncbi:MAG: YdcF family protein [Alphaproteobacteria bacterium]|nr:MAG: YdcF family protein [Alphaproteobacteria bacterium]